MCLSLVCNKKKRYSYDLSKIYMSKYCTYKNKCFVPKKNKCLNCSIVYSHINLLKSSATRRRRQRRSKLRKPKAWPRPLFPVTVLYMNWIGNVDTTSITKAKLFKYLLIVSHIIYFCIWVIISRKKTDPSVFFFFFCQHSSENHINNYTRLNFLWDLVF